MPALRILYSGVWDTELYRTQHKSKQNILNQMLWENRVGSNDYKRNIRPAQGVGQILQKWNWYRSHLSLHDERKTCIQDLGNSISQGEEIWKSIGLPGIASCLEWPEYSRFMGKEGVAGDEPGKASVVRC